MTETRRHETQHKGGTSITKLVDVSIEERHPIKPSDEAVIRRLIHYNDGHAIWWESYTAYWEWVDDGDCETGPHLSLYQGHFVQDGSGMGRMTWAELDSHEEYQTASREEFIANTMEKAERLLRSNGWVLSKDPGRKEPHIVEPTGTCSQCGNPVHTIPAGESVFIPISAMEQGDEADLDEIPF